MASGSSPGFGGAGALAVGNETVGIDDGGAFLAFAYMGAELQRLAESEPALAGKAALGDGAPQDQDVDAAVGAAGGGVLGRPSGALTPAPPQGCTQGTRPVRAAAMILSVISWYRLVRSAKDLWAGAGWGMGGLRDGRAKASLSPVAPVTRPHTALFLS